MTGIVVEIGPDTVRGPNPADAEWVSAGIDGIDDELTLVDDRAVGTVDAWRKVMRDVLGESAEVVTVVCPTWWPSPRVDLVRDAASAVASNVVMLRRAEVPRDERTVLVEAMPDFVAVSSPGGIIKVVAQDDTDALVATIPKCRPVLADRTGPHVDSLCAKGFAVTVTEPDWVCRSLEPIPFDDADPKAWPPIKRRRSAAVLAGAVLVVAALRGGFVAGHDRRADVADIPMSLLVEGRVGVMLPSRWVVQRVTSGPGSARVQVVSPDDDDIAVHVTQSPLPQRQSLTQAAESLRAALSQEKDGVFADFDPSGRRADRAVITYREIRADRHVEWFVMVDGSLRIAIGCQSAPGREEAVRDACDRAIGSVHAVF